MLPTTSPFRPRPAVLVACVAVLCLIWSSTWLVIAEGLRDLPPFTAGATRFALASALMLLVAPALARREGGDRPGLRLAVIHGSLNFAASYGIVYWVETRLPSGLVSVLWSTFPVFMAVCSHVALPGERLHRQQWLGFLGAFAGVVLLFATDVRDVGPEGLVAAALLLLSPLASALGTTYVKAQGDHYSSALLNRNGMLVGASLLAIVAVASESPSEVQWTTRAIASVVYLAVVGTVVSFSLYFWSMRYARAYQLSLIAYITPAVALLLGAAVAHEPVGVHTFAGLALILSGVGAVLRRRKRLP